MKQSLIATQLIFCNIYAVILLVAGIGSGGLLWIGLGLGLLVLGALGIGRSRQVAKAELADPPDRTSYVAGLLVTVALVGCNCALVASVMGSVGLI